MFVNDGYFDILVENYVKGEEREVEDKVDLPFHENVIHMKVASGSKIRNVMGYAMKQMKVKRKLKKT